MRVTPLRALLGVGIIVFIAAGYGWWHWVYSSPSRVFNRMIGTMLSTSSVTKSVMQDDSGQKLDQKTALISEPTQRIRSISRLTQGENGATVVDTESIAAPTIDFVRYLGIKTDQKTANGKDFDFKSVLGVWGKADENDTDSGGAQLFNQTVLGVVPVANISATDRKKLVEQILDSDVYTVDYSTIKKQTINHRPVYTYEVKVLPVAYVTMLKAFARSIGLQQLEQVDPSQYQNSEALRFSFDVDVWSSQLTKIAYTDSPRTETYAGYGARLDVQLPTDSITIQELQTRLQQVQ